MIIDIGSHNYNITQHFRDLLTTKVARLDKFFDKDIKIKIFCKQSKGVCVLELTIVLDSIVIRAEVSCDDMYSNIDTALKKLEKQIIKHNTKTISKSKKTRLQVSENTDLQEIKDRRQIVKIKKFEIIAMSLEDAIDRLELIGHSFFVFKDRETLKTSVVYERKDGDYGVITSY